MTPRREHVALTMALGLLASLSVHLPVYGALGVLADKLLAEAPRERASGPSDDGMLVEFDLETEEDADEEEEPEERERDDLEDTEEEGEPTEDLDEVTEDETPEPVPEPEEEEEEEEEEPEEMVEQVQSPPENLHAVTQRSQDPTVDTPDDPRFIAEENNRVEQETVARIRSMVQDDPEPTAGEPQEESEAEDEGNADEELVREMEEREAEDQRLASDATQAERASTAREEERVGGEGDGSERERVEAERARRANAGGREVETETIVVSDGIGTFTITRPVRSAEGSGGGDAGGERGAGREARVARGGGAGGSGPNLQIGWSQFEAVMGEEQLEREREEYAQARLSQQRGRSAERQRRWRQFRTAIENYVSSVQPGNQTALNTAASPFASFLADMHRRIHMQYHQFLGGLRPGGPMSDMTLQTRLEIILGGDGTVDRVGVVRTSGNLQFDLGAFTAVMDAVPFATPPSSILSGDGKVYLHWTFKRNQPYCHVSHAAPYILPNPPAGGSADEPGTPIPGGPEWGSVVPEGTERNYGLGRRDSESDAEPESESESESDAESESESESEPDSRPAA
jgi:chemotaxis protein histidine kinase CheA